MVERWFLDANGIDIGKHLRINLNDDHKGYRTYVIIRDALNAAYQPKTFVVSGHGNIAHITRKT